MTKWAWDCRAPFISCFSISLSYVSLVVPMRGRLYCACYFQFTDKNTEVQSSAEVRQGHIEINYKTRNRAQTSDSWRSGLPTICFFFVRLLLKCQICNCLMWHSDHSSYVFSISHSVSLSTHPSNPPCIYFTNIYWVTTTWQGLFSGTYILETD